MEIIGWIGGLLFAFCAVPQAIKTYKTKLAGDISWWFLGMWVFGEIFTLIYVIDDNTFYGNWQYPLLANYFFNIILVSFIIFVKWKSERKSERKSG